MRDVLGQSWDILQPGVDWVSGGSHEGTDFFLYSTLLATAVSRSERSIESTPASTLQTIINSTLCGDVRLLLQQQGKDGRDGRAGPQGPIGPHGRDGFQGPAGLHGRDGLQGPAGPPGTKGEKGDRGMQLEGLLDCKVQVVLDNYQGELVYTVPVIQTMYVLTDMCNVDLHVNCV